MPSTPSDSSSDRRFSEREVRIILKTAAELQHREAGDDDSDRRLTLAELEEIASGAGIETESVRRAVAKLDGDRSAPHALSIVGAPQRISLEREVDGELPASAHETVVDEIRRRTGELGIVSIIGQTLTWGTKGPGEAMQVTVAPRQGRRTAIRVEVNLSELAGIVTVVGGATTVLAGGISVVAVGASLAALPIAVGVAGGAWLLGRLSFRAAVRSTRREVERIMDAVEAQVKRSMAMGLESGASPVRDERRLASSDTALDSHSR
jgi:hypothetical protein